MRRAVLALALVLGCGRKGGTISVLRTIGGPGRRPGEFARVRCVAAADKLYTIDMTGRVQVFSRPGEFVMSWLMPEVRAGTPEGISIASNGDILVADTHYGRVVRFSADGKLRGFIGEKVLTYPLDVDEGPGGELYVCEYGGETDRVAVFSNGGELLRSWTGFRRPSGLALAREKVYVADAANHAVKVFDLEGSLLSTWRGFYYPYDVDVDEEGFVWVAEFGANGVRAYSPSGELVGSLEGLNHPWTLDCSRGEVYIADADSHVVRVAGPLRAGARAPARGGGRGGG